MRIAIAIFLTLIVVVVSVFFLVPPLLNHLATELINDQYSPRSLSDSRMDAVKRSSESLSAISEPNLALSLSLKRLQPLIGAATRVAATQTDVTIDNVDVRLNEQTITLSADIAGRIQDIGGTFAGTATGTVTVAANGRSIVLTPALDRVQLASLDVSGYRLPAVISETVVTTLNSYIANVNGRIHPVEIETPAKLFDGQVLEFGDRLIKMPDHTVIAATLLIEEEHLTWLGKLDQVREVAVEQARATDKTENYSAFKKSFMEKGGPLLKMAGLDGIALSSDLLESIFNDLLVPNGMITAGASLEAAWRNAHRMAGPDFSLFLPAEEITRIVETLIVDDIQKAAADAGIVLSGTTLALSDGALSLEATGEAIFINPAPGRAVFRIRISISPVSEKDALSLLPRLTGIEILSAKLEGVDTTKLLAAINLTLTRLVSNFEDALPAIPIDLHPFMIEKIDFADAASQAPGLTITPNIIPAIGIGLERAAILLTRRGLSMLVDVTMNSGSLPQRARGADPRLSPQDVRAIEALFITRSGVIPHDTSGDEARAFLSWKRLAETVNARWADAGGIRVAYSFDTGQQPMDSTPIELFKKPTYECSMGRRCSFNSCADRCTRDPCNWSCRACTDVPCPTWREPLRFCQKCINSEPFCEANKVTCRLGREAEYQACRAACDLVANTKKAACDVQANLEKSGCDVGRSIQEAASQVGGIGRIGGTVGASGTIHANTSVLRLTNDRPGIRFEPEFMGSMRIEGTVDFVPYDIGHVLVCPAKGKVAFSTDIAVPLQSPVVNASLTEYTEDEENSDGLYLVAKVSSFEIGAKITPPPAEAILTQNPHLLIVCNPILGSAITVLTIVGKAKGLSGDDLIRSLTGSKVATILTGDFSYEMGGLTFPIRIDPVSLRIGGITYSLHPQLGEGEIWFTFKSMSE